ncbi:copper resistance protein [Burkholderia singularis]|nr:MULTISPECIES: copper resistance protein CopC [Burkholderia]AOK31092.1 copper resistance protein [Burkholderia sp. Bp7605]KVE23708.1 copper resistance protein [Burkholderia singularis]
MLMARGGIAAALALTLPGFASAHAKPEQTQPPANAVVAAPSDVVINFTETLEPAFSSIAVVDAAGVLVTTDKSIVDASRKHMSVALKPLQPGAYTVKWVAVATDGHRTQGSYKFSVK